MRTPAAPFRRTGRLCRGQSPGRSRYAFVPGSVAIQVCDGLSPRREGPVRPGSRAGRVVRRLLLFAGGAAARGRVDLGRCLGTKPVTLGQLHAEPVCSPTHPRGAAARGTAFRNRRVRPASHPSVRLPGLRPRTPEADSWSSDNRVSSSGLAPLAPVRLRLAGRAVVQCLTKRLTSNTSLVCSMW